MTREASAPPEEVPARDPGPTTPPPVGGRDPSSLDGDYRPTAWLFLRALGAVYVVVFVSIAVQVITLVGKGGLLPVPAFLAAHRGDGLARLWRLPTLFWLWDADIALRGGAILGIALGLGLLLGWRPRICLVACWALFLSYVTVGRDFFWFQWDNLLLEASVLGLLLPVSPGRAPHPWVVFLFQWLVFRVLFESGIAKVQQGAQSWFPLMAMAWYYETAPLPSVGGWWAHQLPLGVHRVTSALTLLGELLGPLLIWARRDLRRLGFLLIVGFQVLIQATANYGYFNVLTAALAIFLLDARDLRWLPAWLRGAPRTAEAGEGPRLGRRRPVVATLAAAVFLLTLLELMVLLAGRGLAASPTLVTLRDLVQPFRFASKYHLFAHIDPRRIEPEIEWTVDQQTWRPYVMHYRPGPTDRRPPIVAPHQPRVDFQMWFFTLGRDGGQHEYFNTLVQRLCAREHRAEALFLADSRPSEAPAIIRVAYYHYRMTDRATLARTGQYWTRELVAYHPAAHFCDSPSPPRF